MFRAWASLSLVPGAHRHRDWSRGVSARAAPAHAFPVPAAARSGLRRGGARARRARRWRAAVSNSRFPVAARARAPVKSTRASRATKPAPVAGRPAPPAARRADRRSESSRRDRSRPGAPPACRKDTRNGRAGAALSDTGRIADREHVVVVPARVAIGRHDATPCPATWWADSPRADRRHRRPHATHGGDSARHSGLASRAAACQLRLAPPGTHRLKPSGAATSAAVMARWGDGCCIIDSSREDIKGYKMTQTTLCGPIRDYRHRPLGASPRTARTFAKNAVDTTGVMITSQPIAPSRAPTVAHASARIACSGARNRSDAPRRVVRPGCQAEGPRKDPGPAGSSHVQLAHVPGRCPATCASVCIWGHLHRPCIPTG